MNRDEDQYNLLLSSLAFKFTLIVIGSILTILGVVLLLWWNGWSPDLLLQLRESSSLEDFRRVWFVRVALICSVTVLFVSVMFYFLIRFDVLIPVRTLLVANRKTDSTLPEYIPNEAIPDNEIGRLMQSRNDHLNTLGEFYRTEAIETLVEAVDAKDPYTRGHSYRVGELGMLLAEKADFDSGRAKDVKRAGILHDLGKIGIPEQILRKPGDLTAEEFSRIENHPERGAAIIRLQNLSDEIIKGIRHHHERYDGEGYPDGLSGDSIPLFGRILAVADAMDAMLTDRLYRSALSLEETREELRENAGSQFDPDLSQLALSLLVDPDWELLPNFDEHRERPLFG